MIKAINTARTEGKDFQKIFEEAGVEWAAKGMAEELPVKQADISKMVSLLWKNETKEVKKKYDELSALRKQEVRLSASVL